LASAACVTSEAGVAGTITTCSANPEVTFDVETATVECIYNHNLLDPNYPNCCMGSYVLTVNKTVLGVPDPEATTVDVRQWGGNYGSCITGPYPSGWPVTSSGIPRRNVYYAQAGLNAVITIPGPIKAFNSGANLMIANRYTAALHTHDGFYVARTSTKPYAIDPIDDRNGTDLVNAGVPTGRDSYDFLCLDETYEVTNRIRVYTQEWNTYYEFLAYLAAEGASGDPNVSTSEPCAGVGIEDQCNDIADWDDYGNLYPNYPTNPATDLDDRFYYFPRLVP
jgi:hypothetical protein